MALLLGFLFFLYRFGWQKLDPTEIDWLLNGRDPSMFFLGWHFFRLSPAWSWPLGEIPGLLHPMGTSIALTDSLPLVAIPLRWVQAILPKYFQFFGLWHALSYGLQAYFGYRLIERWVDDRWLRALGGAFFLTAPIFLYNSAHIAVDSHWILLAAMVLYFRRRTESPFLGAQWCGLGVIAAWIHPYLTVMVIAFFFVWLLKESLDRKPASSKRSLAWIAAIFTAAVGLSWQALGYFSSGAEPIGLDRHIRYSMNLNSWFNPRNLSSFLPQLPNLHEGQVIEGYAYLGLGLMILALGAIMVFLLTKSRNNDLSVEIGLFSALVVALALFALGPSIAWGNSILWKFDPLKPHAFLVSSFRAIGRFGWPITYSVVIFSFSMLNRLKPHRGIRLVVALLFLLQCIDNEPLIHRSHRNWKAPSEDYENLRQIEDLNAFKHLKTVPGLSKTICYEKDWVELSMLASEFQMTTNTGWAARFSHSEAAEERRVLQRQVELGQLETETLYVIHRDQVSTESRLMEKAHCRTYGPCWVCRERQAP